VLLDEVARGFESKNGFRRGHWPIWRFEFLVSSFEFRAKEPWPLLES